MNTTGFGPLCGVLSPVAGDSGDSERTDQDILPHWSSYPTGLVLLPQVAVPGAALIAVGRGKRDLLFLLTDEGARKGKTETH